jgi:hypothetical protein
MKKGIRGKCGRKRKVGDRKIKRKIGGKRVNSDEVRSITKAIVCGSFPR